MAKNGKPHEKQSRRLRSQLWFDNPENPGKEGCYDVGAASGITG